MSINITINSANDSNIIHYVAAHITLLYKVHTYLQTYVINDMASLYKFGSALHASLLLKCCRLIPSGVWGLQTYREGKPNNNRWTHTCKCRVSFSFLPKGGAKWDYWGGGGRQVCVHVQSMWQTGGHAPLGNFEFGSFIRCNLVESGIVFALT